MKRAILASLLLAVGGCSGDTDAVPGAIVVRLEATNVDDGAMIVTISGGPVSNVSAPGYDLTSHTDASGTHVLVIGAFHVGDLVTLDVPDIANAQAYVATVDQVADGATFALLDPSPSRVRVVPPE